jgi:hypothetical protein
MQGQTASASIFGEPIESSVYFFDHHRFDQVEQRILERRGHDLLVHAELTGDIDGLGIPSIDVEGWLMFDGIVVSLSDGPRTVDEARARLCEFTDPTGLICSATTGSGYRFVSAIKP